MSTTILLGIISIGILIFVHELGHFLAARAAGIKVEVFSIGWGRGIVSFMWKGTRIQIGWIPFGGYCKMAGDSPKDERTFSPGEYYASPPHRRIIVAVAGPLSNYIFSVILFILIVAVGYQIQTFSNRIILARDEQVVRNGVTTPAQAAGLRDGDIITAINGNTVKNWDDVTENIVRSPLKQITITVLRGGEVLSLTAVPELDEETGRGLIGIHPWVEPIVGEVIPGEAGDKAGLKSGDRILEVQGKAIEHHVDFYDAIEGRSGSALALTVEREGRTLELTLIPNVAGGYDSAGIYFKQLRFQSERYPFFTAVGKGAAKSVQGVVDTVNGILLVVSGKIRARSAVAGPAKLIYLSGVIAKEGFIYFLQVMSYISIAFFIMNLIPFPALDGSHIIISLYEVAARKRPNLEVVHKIQTIGFVLLIGALLVITMNDISSFLGR